MGKGNLEQSANTRFNRKQSFAISYAITGNIFFIP